MTRWVPDIAGLYDAFAEHRSVRQEMVLMAWRGSVAHGTYRPNTDPHSIDDKDLMGIVVPDEYTLVGLNQFGSRGTLEIQRNPWDVVVYEYRKALSLLEKGNPNILCLLWMPEEMYLHIGDAGRLLLERRELFSAASAFAPFRGYAQSQLKKMRGGAYQGYMGEKRRALVDEFGYDTKNASHLIRILRQGIEFLASGEMVVVRHDAEELLEIKRGEWSLERVLREARALDDALAIAAEHCVLPERPNRAEINRLAVDMVRKRPRRGRLR